MESKYVKKIDAKYIDESAHKQAEDSIKLAMKLNGISPEEAQRAHEYQRTKAREEWIKMNKKRLDEIEAHRLRAVKWLLVITLTNLIVSLLNL